MDSTKKSKVKVDKNFTSKAQQEEYNTENSFTHKNVEFKSDMCSFNENIDADKYYEIFEYKKMNGKEPT